jgi:hypothetical protein
LNPRKLFILKMREVNMKKMYLSVFCLLRVTAQAAQVLPMYNYKLPTSFSAQGNTVFAGVSVDVQAGGQMIVSPTQTVYYLPTMAEVTGSAVAISAGAVCDAVQAEFKNEEALSAANSAIVSFIADGKKNLDLLTVKMPAAQTKCLSSKTKIDVATFNRENADSKVTEISTQVLQQKTAYQTCSKVALKPEDCAAEKAAFTALAETLGEETNTLIAAQQAESWAKQSEKLDCGNYDNLTSVYGKQLEAVASYQDSLGKIMATVNSQINAFGTQLGGTTVATISSNSLAQQQALLIANPGYDIRPVETTDLSFHLSAGSEFLGNVSRQTVLGIAIAGIEPAATASGNAVLGEAAAKYALKDASSAAVSVFLSRIGACSQNNVRNAMFKFSYKGYSYLSGSVEYRLMQAYSKMESTTQKGGLFTTSSAHELLEDMKGEQTFKFALLTDDPKIDAKAMKETLQKETLDLLLKNFAEAKNSAQGSTLSQLSPGESGAQVLSDGLMKSCPHVYCIAAGLGLKTLQAIFGSSESSEDIKKKNDQLVSQDFAWNTVYERKGSSVVNMNWQL